LFARVEIRREKRDDSLADSSAKRFSSDFDFPNEMTSMLHSLRFAGPRLMLRFPINSLAFLAVVGVALVLKSLAHCEEPKKQAAEPKLDAPLDFDEAILKHFKQATDTASLVAYLKERSASDDDLLAIPTLIKRLGSEKFTERREASSKLIALGLPAFMPLHDTLNDKDPERSQQAKLAIQKLDRGTRTVAIPPIATHMLMKRKPDGLLEVLLRYLPFTTDPDVEEDIYYGIDELSGANGQLHPALVKALDDPLAARRAVAGCIIARVGNDEQKQKARGLLKDKDAHVRLRTAQGMLAGFDTMGLPTLIELLDAKPIPIAWQAEELLVWAAKDDAPKALVWFGGPRATEAKSAWQKWWDAAKSKLDLRRSAKEPWTPRLFSTRTGAVLMGSDGRVRWDPFGSSTEQPLKQVTCMPDGRLYGSFRFSSARQEPFTGDFRNRNRFCEADLQHNIVRQTEWRGLPTNFTCEIGPNGVATIIDPENIFSIGLEGAILSSSENGAWCARHRPKGGIGSRSSYNGLVVMAILKRGGGFTETLFFEPITGDIVCQLPALAEPALLPTGASPHFTSSNARIVIRLVHDYWILESGKGLQRLTDSRLRYEDGIGVLRNGQLVRWPLSSDMSVCSHGADLRTVATIKANHRFPHDRVITVPFRLVSFGFP
jgi:HEAT repeat protein